MTKKPQLPKVAQPVPEEVMADLLSFIELKFYPGHRVSFEKDKKRLVDWVIRFPARWLYKRGVTLETARYRQLLQDVLMDALRHGNFGQIKYLPGYLRSVVESHFDHHEDEIYEEAKALRRMTDAIVTTLGQLPRLQRDIASEFANMDRLHKAAKSRRAAPAPLTKQRELF